MYESPISVTSIYEQIASEVIKNEEEYIVRNVQQMGIDVNKDELIKALTYDRGQYDKGYIDGRVARDAEIVRCKDCKHWDEEFEECDHQKVGRRVQVPAGFYCGWGERRTDDGEIH